MGFEMQLVINSLKLMKGLLPSLRSRDRFFHLGTNGGTSEKSVS